MAMAAPVLWLVERRDADAQALHQGLESIWGPTLPVSIMPRIMRSTESADWVIARAARGGACRQRLSLGELREAGMRPTVRSRRLGARLSHYRNERGISGATVAAQLSVGQPQLSRMETGKAKITTAALERLVEVLGIPQAEARTLEELRRRSTEPG
jgi:Helix-turn-helix domain